ncbi:MAG: hypothetical protein R3D67_11270 [Hyphomicrobiaceae bacterium]
MEQHLARSIYPLPYSDPDVIKAALIMTDGLFNTSFNPWARGRRFSRSAG